MFSEAEEKENSKEQKYRRHFFFFFWLKCIFHGNASFSLSLDYKATQTFHEVEVGEGKDPKEWLHRPLNASDNGQPTAYLSHPF